MVDYISSGLVHTLNNNNDARYGIYAGATARSVDFNVGATDNSLYRKNVGVYGVQLGIEGQNYLDLSSNRGCLGGRKVNYVMLNPEAHVLVGNYLNVGCSVDTKKSLCGKKSVAQPTVGFGLGVDYYKELFPEKDNPKSKIGTNVSSVSLGIDAGFGVTANSRKVSGAAYVDGFCRGDITITSMPRTNYLTGETTYRRGEQGALTTGVKISGELSVKLSKKSALKVAADITPIKYDLNNKVTTGIEGGATIGIIF